MDNAGQGRELSMQMKSISSEPAPKGLKDVKHAEEGKATRLVLLLSDQSIQE